jgi:hypothetical protein
LEVRSWRFIIIEAHPQTPIDRIVFIEARIEAPHGERPNRAIRSRVGA